MLTEPFVSEYQVRICFSNANHFRFLSDETVVKTHTSTICPTGCGTDAFTGGTGSGLDIGEKVFELLCPSKHISVSRPIL